MYGRDEGCRYGSSGNESERYEGVETAKKKMTSWSDAASR
jgi:hypothetical protein